ncbi:MAG: PSD1 and planctomycete cytochrome C domain-containing protein [Acidobacteriota bacterium]|nr:PSD1 and planctomycete cytochrome C domain-containing protein [Acidobacteriota bacterium]
MRLLLSLLVTAPLFAQQTGIEFFEKSVRPLFVANCYACHGAKMQMGGLNLSSGAGLDSFVVKGDPAQSRLYRAIGYAETVKMPPTGKLPEESIAILKKWIETGAAFPNGFPKDIGPASISTGKKITAKDREHWAFQPVREQAQPNVSNEAWVKSPIDRFILAKLDEKKISPAAPASKLTLLRRVTYDLIGLPPTPEEIEAFVADKTAGAFAKVVDRLLASPQYGERWGRHWLDVARFADSTGMDEDHIYPYAWRYRDYVVKAFNDDLPYNRFVTEQLAGDLLPKPNVVATGFLALGPKPLAQQDRVQMVYDVVDEQIDTTSKAFLGLTVACARCHDHKFDPILTKDYYAMASMFASTTDFRNLGRPGSVSYIYYAPLDSAAFGRYQTARWRLYGKQLEMETALGEDSAREYALLRPKVADFLTAAWKLRAKHVVPEGLDAKQVEKWLGWIEKADEKARQSYLKKWFEATDETIGAVAREYQESYLKSAAKWDDSMEKWRRSFATELAQDRDLPARPKPDAEEHPFFANATFDSGPLALPDGQRVAALRKEFLELEKSMPEEPPMASAVCDGPSVDQHVFLHGDHHNPGDPVAKTFPVVLAGETQHPVEKGSGRLEFANWLVNPENPMPSRVMVNRIWQWHFGEALVRTPNNWGKTGDVPVQKELLDFLAKKFVDSGWSVKAMHRMILLSSTYQMSAEADGKTREADPQNRLCSRFNRTRMSVEQIRDTILALDGGLDLTMGGSLLPSGKGKRQTMDADELTRRTLYIPVRRGSVPALLSTFDFGDATSPGDGRPRTNVAPQALFMMNGKLVVDRSRGFAKRLLDNAALSDTQRIERAYLMALTRRPDASEIDSALSYIQGLEERLAKPDAHFGAWQSFCHILMSTNEALYLN